jgi:hypothetical protein
MIKPLFTLHNIRKVYRSRKRGGGVYFYPHQWSDWDAIEDILMRVNAVDGDDCIRESNHLRATIKEIEYRVYWS